MARGNGTTVEEGHLACKSMTMFLVTSVSRGHVGSPRVPGCEGGMMR